MEALIHNLCTLQSRSGSQTVFSSINFGMDTTPEGRMVSKNLMLAQESGLGNGETAIFPITIMSVMEGYNLNPGDPNYDLFKLACKVSAKRLYPNFNNIGSTWNKPYFKPGHPESIPAVMGCRTRVIGNTWDPENEITPGRGNLSFSTLNLPRLGIEAHGDIDKFFKDEFNISISRMQKYKKCEFSYFLDNMLNIHQMFFYICYNILDTCYLYSAYRINDFSCQR